MVDFADLPLVDVHCHPFRKQGPLTVEQFVELASFGGGSARYMEEGGVAFTAGVEAELQRNKRSTSYFRCLVRDLAALLDVEARLETVVDRRNQVVTADNAGYVRQLYADAGIQTLIADFGFPQPPIDVATFRGETPAEVIPIFRIEPLIAELLQAEVGWPEFRRRYDERISVALEGEGYRGLKSIIAYRTGLDVRPESRAADQGAAALDGLLRGGDMAPMKQLRDHLLCRALELCIDHDVPMQIHTGMGDFEVNLPLCRPAYLMDLLRSPPYRACRVVLVHGGYPYHREAGYLAHVLPRVYCDLSEGIPFAGHAAPRIIAEVLEMAPLTKVLYGSDAFMLPEMSYTAAKRAKQALGHVLGELVTAGVLERGDVRTAGAMILAENARALYHLDSRRAA